MLVIKRILSLVFLLASVALIIYAIGLIRKSVKFSSTVKLESLWAEDINNLVETGKLPKYWDKIRVINKTAPTGDKLAIQWSHEVSAPIQLNPTGDYKLEVFFLSQNESPHLKALVQMNMVHIKTGNSVWELDRTYDLK